MSLKTINNGIVEQVLDRFFSKNSRGVSDLVLCEIVLREFFNSLIRGIDTFLKAIFKRGCFNVLSILFLPENFK